MKTDIGLAYVVGVTQRKLQVNILMRQGSWVGRCIGYGRLFGQVYGTRMGGQDADYGALWEMSRANHERNTARHTKSVYSRRCV